MIQATCREAVGSNRRIWTASAGSRLLVIVPLFVIAAGATFAEGGVIAHWSFDEIVNTNQFAEDTGSYTATIADLPHVSLETTNPVFGGGAAHFQGGDTPEGSQTVEDSGVGAFARVPYITEMTAGTSLTVSAWVQRTSSSWWQAVLGDWSDNGGGTSYLFGTSGSGTNTGGAVHALTNTAGNAAPGGFQGNATATLTADEWFHVAWVYERNEDGSQATISKYLNGELHAPQDVWGDGSTPGFTDLRNPDTDSPGSRPEVWIGLKEDNGADFEGYVDELWIFDQALNVDQIGDLMDSNLPPSAGGIPGDFDNSGGVENADLTLLLNNWASSVPPVPAGWVGNPQPTGPAIDNDELTALLNNWGRTSGGGSTVPEPASFGLMVLGALVLVCRRCYLNEAR